MVLLFLGADFYSFSIKRYNPMKRKETSIVMVSYDDNCVSFYRRTGISTWERYFCVPFPFADKRVSVFGIMMNYDVIYNAQKAQYWSQC